VHHNTFGKFATGVNDTSGKFATSVDYTSGNFATGINDTGGKFRQLLLCFRVNRKSLDLPYLHLKFIIV
jgi:hypothetical protein